MRKFDKYYIKGQKQKDELKSGLTNQSDIALQLATKKVKYKPRNLKGTLDNEKVCPYYHPLFCNCKGHTSNALAECKIKAQSKDEQKYAMQVIENDKIQEQVAEDERNACK